MALRGLEALRSRNYVLYLTGHFTSQTGAWVEQTAVSWILYELTNSALLLGLAGLARAVPTIALALVGGAIADRVPRRTMLYCTESTMLVNSLVIGFLAWSGRLEYWHLYALSFVNGTLSAFSVPARQALFAGLVPKTAVQSAVTFNAVAVRCGVLIGPSIGGAALAYGSYALPFWINAASFIGMLGALAAMRLSPVPSHEKAKPGTLRQGMSEGLRFVWDHAPLRVALALEVVSGLFGHNITLITIIARDVLGTGAQGLGWLLSALGAGGMLAMIFMVFAQLRHHMRVILTAGAIYSLLLASFALSHWLALSVVLLFMLGTCDGIWGVNRNTLAQTTVPDALRGRVMSVVVLTTRGSAPLGRLQAGFLADFVGAPVTTLIGATVIFIAIGRWWRLRGAEL
ncbi:MAG TPA: MFS transporter [Burkholderiales bacterium]|jgi:predicted MFS family arabinose efflux permease|nr:MFS transporter [Burkholderiales bacterium]